MLTEWRIMMKPLIGICANYLSDDAIGLAAGIGAKISRMAVTSR